MKPKVAHETPKRFKLTVYYEGPDAGFAAEMAFQSVRSTYFTHGLNVKVEASWEELSEGQQPEL